MRAGRSESIADPPAPRLGWRGRLALDFERQGARTAVSRREAAAPLAFQRPFYPEGPDVCHGVILHPPGGLADGDQLDVEATIASAAHALVTTTAAAKIYRCPWRDAVQRTQLRVEAGGFVEWLPQETIVFDGARYRQSTEVELAPDAHVILWDITRFGRSARGERFLTGDWRSYISVYRDGRPMWVDRQRIEGGGAALSGGYGLGGRPVSATLVWLGRAATPGLVAEARRLWDSLSSEGEVGVSRLDSGLICRYLGPSTWTARHWFASVWNHLRRELLGRPACPPRIWET